MNTQSVSKQEEQDLIKEMIRIMGELEGRGLIALDVSEVSSLTDYFIIADFQSLPQMQGAYEALLKLVKERDFFIPKQNNMSFSSDWIVLDAGSIVCHLMTKEARSFYNLEKLWENGKILGPF